MYIRVTRGRFNPANYEQIQRMVEEQLLPGIKQRPGFRSYQGGIDREANTLVAVSFWDTREQAEGLASGRGPFEALGVVFDTAETYELIASI